MSLTREIGWRLVGSGVLFWALSGAPASIADEPAASAPLPTARQLREQLKATLAPLRSVRMLIAERSVTLRKADATPDFLIKWNELFLDGDRAQLRSDWVFEDSAEWWIGADPSNVPLTTDTFSDFPGEKYCYRPQGDPTFATILNVQPNPNRRISYSVYYGATSASHQLGSVLLPLAKLNRSWEQPEKDARLLLVDRLLLGDPAEWQVVGRELLGQQAMIKVVVPLSAVKSGPVVKSFPLKYDRNDGKLSTATVWNVWFSDDEHHFPMRIETDRRYVYDGKIIPLVFTGPGRFGPVYSVDGYKDYGQGIWFPETGKQVSYTTSKPTPHLALDAIVDAYLEKGHVDVGDAFDGYLSREWKILELEPITPAAPLWIDPPVGAHYHNIDTGERHTVVPAEDEK